MKVSEEKMVSAICKDSFFDFFKNFWQVTNPRALILNWHIKYLCDELQTIAERVFLEQEKEYDLCINISPGSSKTTIVSHAFPAWIWTRMPSAQVIVGMYAHNQATKEALSMRDIVQSDLYRRCFPNIELREDQNTKGLFMNNHRGFRLSAGVDGQLTGNHGHFLICDDLLNPKEALSDADRMNANKFLDETLPSRKIRFKENVVPIIQIQQRLHQNDTTGHWLEKTGGKGIKHICLPAEQVMHPCDCGGSGFSSAGIKCAQCDGTGKTDDIKPKELRKFYIGGLFDPIRLNKSVLEELRREQGEYGYAAQYQQSPVPLGGGMFKIEKLNRYDTPPKIVELVRSWDKAGTKVQPGQSSRAKYTVGCLAGLDNKGRFWILDIVRDRLAAAEREKLIKDTADSDGDEVDLIRVEIEGGSGGKESGEGTAIRLAGRRIEMYHPTGDKAARAYEFASQVGAGTVNILNRSWTNAFIEELRFFPFGTYSDQVDTSSDCFNALCKRKIKVGSRLWK